MGVIDKAWERQGRLADVSGKREEKGRGGGWGRTGYDS